MTLAVLQANQCPLALQIGLEPRSEPRAHVPQAMTLPKVRTAIYAGCETTKERRQARQVPAAFEDLGERALNSISEPVRLFRVLITEDPRINAASAPPEVPSIAALPFDNMSDDAGEGVRKAGVLDQDVHNC